MKANPRGHPDAVCAKLPLGELEKYFWARGPLDVEKLPGKAAQKAWDEAKEVCIECPLYLRCRAVSLGEPYGVWGGRDQHERYLERRRRSKALMRLKPGERAAVAAQMYARVYGHRGATPLTVARETGYSTPAVQALVAEHQALLEQQRDEARAAIGWTEGSSAPQAGAAA